MDETIATCALSKENDIQIYYIVQRKSGATAIIFNNIYLTIYFILSDDLKQKKNYCLAWDGWRERESKKYVSVVCHQQLCMLRIPVLYKRSWFNWMMRFLQHFFFSAVQKGFFSLDSIASLAFHHIKPKLPKILWCFLWYCCTDATFFFFERDKLVPGYCIPDAQP